jgi:hypothetical protein
LSNPLYYNILSIRFQYQFYDIAYIKKEKPTTFLGWLFDYNALRFLSFRTHNKFKLVVNDTIPPETINDLFFSKNPALIILDSFGR